MPEFTGHYDRIKEPKLACNYNGSYEIGEVISWAAAVRRGTELIGKPNGRIPLDDLDHAKILQVVKIAVEASIENGVSMRE